MNHITSITYRWDTRTEFKLTFIENTVGIQVSYDGWASSNYTSNVPLIVLETAIKICHSLQENIRNYGTDQYINDLEKAVLLENENIVNIDIPYRNSRYV